MNNYDHVVRYYAERFPEIPMAQHELVVRGALEGRDAPMTEEGFREWYDQTVEGLAESPEIMAEIRDNPHAIMYREVLILGDDWLSMPILDRIMFHMS